MRNKLLSASLALAGSVAVYATVAALRPTPAYAQSISQEHGALANQNEPITLPAGSAIPADYGLTSGGVYRHKSCIIPVPKHARFWPDMAIRDESGNVLKKFQQPCAYPAYRIATGSAAGAGGAAGTAGGLPTAQTSGYVAYAYQWAPSGYYWTGLETEMIVPGTPNDASANIAWWSGVSPQTANNLVLQPEIIWGQFAYNGGIGTGGQYQMLCGAQFSNAGGDLGYYLCSGGGGDNDDEGGCSLSSVSTNDTVEFLIALIDVTSGCADQTTVSGTQYVCGDWAIYELAADDVTSGAEQTLDIAEAYSGGSDAPPNGALFPLAYTAVYESYGDTGCESGALFNVLALEADNSSSLFNSVAYSPSSGQVNGNPDCNDGAGWSDTLTFVH